MLAEYLGFNGLAVQGKLSIEVVNLKINKSFEISMYHFGGMVWNYVTQAGLEFG